VEREKQFQAEREKENEEHRKKLELFIDTICHEIRNPLNGIFGSTSFIRDEIDSMEKVLLNIYHAMVLMTEEHEQHQHQHHRDHPQSQQPQQQQQQQQWGKHCSQPSPRAMEIVSSKERREQMFDELNHSVTTIKFYLECLMSCANHQKVITNDVLFLSKLESNKLELDLNPFRVVDIIHTPASMFTAELANKNIQLFKDIQVDSSLIAVGDCHKVFPSFLPSFLFNPYFISYSLSPAINS
jgi:signal transduction histidine kinase